MRRTTSEDARAAEPGFLRRRAALLLAGGALPPALRRALQARLERDPLLAAAYDALRRAERAAASSAPLSAGQLDFLEARILEAASAEERPRAPRAAPALAFLGAAAAVALFFTSSRPAPPPPIGGPLQHRGAAESAVERPLGLTVACVDQAARTVVARATAGARTPQSALPCTARGLLAFSSTNLTDRERFAFVVGISRAGEIVWLAPFSRQAASVPMPAGEVSRPVDVLADLGALPHDAGVSLHVLISDEPLRGEHLERQLVDAAARGVPLAALQRLPIEVAHQARIDLTVSAPGQAASPARSAEPERR